MSISTCTIELSHVSLHVRLNYRISTLAFTIELSHVYLDVYDGTIACLHMLVDMYDVYLDMYD
jgi:hypothetical protein